MNYKEKICEIVAGQHSDIELNDDSLAAGFAEIGLDSIDVMTLILLIKKELGVEIDDDALLDIASIDDLIGYVQSQN
ncbi:acyl carrier protein [Pseudoalteromonas sp. GB56]